MTAGQDLSRQCGVEMGHDLEEAVAQVLGRSLDLRILGRRLPGAGGVHQVVAHADREQQIRERTESLRVALDPLAQAHLTGRRRRVQRGEHEVEEDGEIDHPIRSTGLLLDFA